MTFWPFAQASFWAGPACTLQVCTGRSAAVEIHSHPSHSHAEVIPSLRNTKSWDSVNRQSWWQAANGRPISVDAAPACVMYYPHLHSVQVLSRPNPQQGVLSGGVQDKLCEDAPGRCKTALHLPQEGAQGCCRGCPVVFCCRCTCWFDIGSLLDPEGAWAADVKGCQTSALKVRQAAARYVLASSGAARPAAA